MIHGYKSVAGNDMSQRNGGRVGGKNGGGVCRGIGQFSAALGLGSSNKHTTNSNPKNLQLSNVQNYYARFKVGAC